MPRLLAAYAVILMFTAPLTAQQTSCPAGQILINSVCYTPRTVKIDPPPVSGRVRLVGQGASLFGDPPIDCGYGSPNVCSMRIAVNNSVMFSAEGGFRGWSGDCSGTANCHLTVDTDKTVSAKFAGFVDGRGFVLQNRDGRYLSEYGNESPLKLEQYSKTWYFESPTGQAEVTLGSPFMLRTRYLGGVDRLAISKPDGTTTVAALDTKFTWKVSGASDAANGVRLHYDATIVLKDSSGRCLASQPGSAFAVMSSQVLEPCLWTIKEY